MAVGEILFCSYFGQGKSNFGQGKSNFGQGKVREF